MDTGSSFWISSAPQSVASASSRHAAQNFAGRGRMLGLQEKHQEASFTSTSIRWQVHSKFCSSSIACSMQNVWPQPSHWNCGQHGQRRTRQLELAHLVNGSSVTLSRVKGVSQVEQVSVVV